MSGNASWLNEQLSETGSSVPPTSTYTPTEPAPSQPAEPNRKAKRALAVFAAAVVVAAVFLVGLTSTLGGHKPSPTPDEPAPAAAAQPQTLPATTAADTPDIIGYTASDQCPTGSTQPQLLADTTTDSWWICVRGTEGARLDGQIIHIDFGKPYVVTSVEIVPGAAAKTRGGKDQWDKHRVVHMLQYNFRNGTDVVPVSQDTTGGKGPVPEGPVAKQLEQPVLASTVDVIIQQTERPGIAQTSDPQAPTTASEPVDYTVAIASLKFFGHTPIGR